ncbi:MAG: PIN domain nuclease [Deltaproteobacteria bacterium]|nr:PIN domain nuclease [Deltaproteobacteria bacterium]
MVLIDTSAWIFALKKNFNPAIRNRIDRALLEGEVAVNGIVQLELLGGTKTENEYQRLKRRLNGLYYIESTKELWDSASELAFKLRRKGANIPFTDILIASSAMSVNALLIHADSHFEKIAGYFDLKSESLVKIAS